MFIVSELDMQCGNIKQKELAVLIRQDLEKRQLLEEARKLEDSYKMQLVNSRDNGIETKEENIGVDFE